MAWRFAILAALLLVEFLIFSIRFDTESIEHIDAIWAKWLGQAYLAGKFAVSVVVALIVFGGRRIADAWRQICDAAPAVGFSWRAIGCHAVAIAAFFGLTTILLEGGVTSSAAAVPLIVAWGAAGFLAMAALCAAIMPLSFWHDLIVRMRGPLAFGAVVAVSAIVVAQAVRYFWPLMCGPSMSAIEFLLRLIYGNDVVVFPEEIEIGARSFVAGIGPECSGFEGVGLIAVFAGAFLWSFRDRLQFPQALVLLPLGMGVIWFANVLRIVALVVIGASISEPIAAGGFHSQAGWLAFNAVALGLVYVAWNSRALRIAEERDEAGRKYEYAAGPYLLPLLLLLAVMMVSTAISAKGFDWLYPLRVVATLVALAYFWPTYKARGYLTWTWSWAPLLIGVGVSAMWIGLEPFAPVAADAHADQAQALASVSPALSLLWIVCRAVGSIIAVPMAEELAFRGFLLRKFENDDFQSVPLGQWSWYSLTASSVLFGLLHGRWIAGTIAGFLFAYALGRRGRMMDAIIAHAVANALVTAYVLLTGNWASWS